MGSSGEAGTLSASPGPPTSALRVLPLTDRPGWQAAGEVSLLTRPAWEQALCHLARSDEETCHLELSAVTFVEVAGVSALAMTAQGIPQGRRIVIEEPPAALRRVLDLFWPGLLTVEVMGR
ncbi:anti sigma factor [Streptomyces sviceus ATCC 29083]|uniref:Anti sigma factor n=1 Tax=Streptomyces sviceus (strain ATCC 29083 / DSM 924 / JCM 4929 / NBRC 13980 / NCIMB 11184 / NRRL 5439 / UC 5370) TaxID=463191 RepID=B5I689_STRX2|nr:anti sigma factor [Streptomyces sviceus ATCC 29083]